ncbi:MULTISPECIES: MATE family efflux transporter [Dickeya]|uniref:Multidrug-efflux transporter n=1 Tax=Dickeya aquatica TaxID=1401087 RepID=A0A375A9G0_9GAMM|nr:MULTISPECIES: MATE family efflux transporter [Dickeya]SLM62742.1 Multi antimicrobial extrusion protein (Na(+)/drug antiporter), MATE family of MDR efflux pumps [Dickeya aquatica]
MNVQEKSQEINSYKGAIFKLSYAVYLELISTVASGIIDMIWVARLGGIAVAAVAVATSFENVLMGIMFAVSVGTTILISNRLGTDDLKAVKSYIRSGFICALVFGLSVALISFVFRDQITDVLIGEKSQEIKASVSQFFMIMFPGMIVLYAQMMVDAIFKGHKNTKMPMKTAILANAVIIILDPILIFGWFGAPALGVLGAALATVLGRLVALSWSSYKLINYQDVRNLTHVNPTIPTITGIKNIVFLGFPLSLDFITRMLGTMVLINVVSHFGESYVAAFGIAIKIIIFVTMAYYAIRQASSILLSRRIGEGFPEDSKIITRDACYLGLLITLIAAIILIINPSHLISWFIDDAAVISSAATLLLYLTVYLFPLSFCVGSSGVFVGSGYGTLLTLVTCCGIGLQTLIAITLPYYYHDVVYVWYAMIFGAILQTVLIAYFLWMKIIPQISAQTTRTI